MSKYVQIFLVTCLLALSVITTSSASTKKPPTTKSGHATAPARIEYFVCTPKHVRYIASDPKEVDCPVVGELGCEPVRLDRTQLKEEREFLAIRG